MRAGYAMFPQGNVVSEPDALPDQARMTHELSLANLAGELGFDSSGSRSTTSATTTSHPPR
jgi:hypothetical protein